MIFVPTEGETQLLKRSLGMEAAENLTVCLFNNDRLPEDGDTFADYSELSGSGYARQEISAADWLVIEEGGQSIASAPGQTFAFTGNQTGVYGFLLLGVNSGVLYGVGRFASPSNFNSGDEVVIAPKLKLKGRNNE